LSRNREPGEAQRSSNPPKPSKVKKSKYPLLRGEERRSKEAQKQPKSLQLLQSFQVATWAS